MLKSTPINDLIEQDLTYSHEEIQRIQTVNAPKNGTLVKSFSDAEIDEIFDETDIWGERLGK
jgi:hypothetical protein